MLIVPPVELLSGVNFSTSNLFGFSGPWSGAITYAASSAGAFVLANVDNPTLKRIDVYRSIQAGNLNNPPATSPLWWAPDHYIEYTWDSGTTYDVGDIVQFSGDGHKYESLFSNNLNHAVSDPNWWLDAGHYSLNGLAAFDDKVQSQSLAGDTIYFTVSAAGGDFDVLALLNVVGASVRIQATGGYDQTFSLVGFDGGQIKYFVVQLPAVLTGTDSVTVTMTSATGTAIGSTAIGAIVFGVATDLGGTLVSSASIGIADFSDKQQDAFGNFSIVERAFSRTGKYQCWIDNANLDRVVSLFEDRRAQKTLYVGSIQAGFATTCVYGYFRSFDTALAMPQQSLLSVDLVSLT